MNVNVSLEALLQIGAIVGVGWGIARRLTTIELRVNLMWKVFEKRLGVTKEEMEED